MPRLIPVEISSAGDIVPMQEGGPVVPAPEFGNYEVTPEGRLRIRVTPEGPIEPGPRNGSGGSPYAERLAPFLEPGSILRERPSTALPTATESAIGVGRVLAPSTTSLALGDPGSHSPRRNR